MREQPTEGLARTGQERQSGERGEEMGVARREVSEADDVMARPYNAHSLASPGDSEDVKKVMTKG